MHLEASNFFFHVFFVPVKYVYLFIYLFFQCTFPILIITILNSVLLKQEVLIPGEGAHMQNLHTVQSNVSCSLLQSVVEFWLNYINMIPVHLLLQSNHKWQQFLKSFSVNSKSNYVLNDGQDSWQSTSFAAFPCQVWRCQKSDFTAVMKCDWSIVSTAQINIFIQLQEDVNLLHYNTNIKESHQITEVPRYMDDDRPVL